MCNVWDAALRVVQQLKANQHEAYIVGGAVRDKLLKRDIADVDVVTSAKSFDVEKIFKKSFRMNNEHETVIVREQNEHIEVTTMRGTTIEEDLMRRDLTINSIAYSEHAFIDPLRGIDDIHHRILRSFHPDERMKEDPLRMLRVYRFKSELGFQIDDELTYAIIGNKELLQTVAVERVVKEWIKLLKGKDRNEALSHMQATQLYNYIPHLHLTTKSIEKLSTFPSLRHESDTFCLFLYCVSNEWEDTSLLKKLAISNELLRNVRKRLIYLKERNRKKWDETMLYEASLDVALDVEKGRQFLRLDAETERSLRKKWEALPIKNRGQLALDGHDLLKMKRSPGPWIKETLLWAENAVLTKEVRNEKEELLRALERRKIVDEGSTFKNF